MLCGQAPTNDSQTYLLSKIASTKDFLKKNVEQNPSPSGWAAHYTQTIHDDTLLVDLSLKFQKMKQ